jgi:PAS domain S-box-containing protein
MKSAVEFKTNEQRYQSLVTASSEALYIMSPDWSEMLTLNSRNFLTNTETANPNWLQEYILPDDQPFVTSRIADAIMNKSVFELEHRVIQADGSVGWTFSRAVPILDDNGDIIEWFGAALDITRRKQAEEALQQSEEKFAAAFTSNPNAIILSRTKDGYIIDVNNSFLELVGRLRDEVVGQQYVSLDIFSNSPDRRKLVNILNKDGRIANLEIKIRHKSGALLDVIVAVEPIRINKVEALITTLQDITELKKAEKLLRENEKQLHEINSAKDKLFSIISHDLRSPFTSIIGFSELLIGKIQSNELNDIETYANLIHDSSLNAMSLLTNLLEWSSLQTGRINFSPTKFDLVQNISEAVESMMAQCFMKNISISVRTPSHLDVFADSMMINSVLRNLISNAIKFTKSGGHIIISAYIKDNSVVVEVADNGIGMEQEAVKKLFGNESYTSVRGTENEVGTGLGLIICKEFISKHNGEIWAESVINKGSRFMFSLPHLTKTGGQMVITPSIQKPQRS